MRVQVWMEPTEWAEIKKAAAREQVETGETVSASAWVREACREKMDRGKESTRD